MTDLRERLTMRQQSGSLIEQAEIVRRRHLSSTSVQLTSSGCGLANRRCTSSQSHDGREDSEEKKWRHQRVGFDTPENRRKYNGDKIRHSRERENFGFKSRTPRFKSSRSSSRKRFSQQLKFSSLNNDIDIRNDPEYEFENVFKDNLVSNKAGKKCFQVNMGSCENIYLMAKEIRTLQKDLSIADVENRSLRRKFQDADNKVVDLEEKLVVKNDVLGHFEDELAGSRRKIETDGVFIKDLEFENRNKRKLIDELEKKNEELKKTQKKLGDENSQIRRLAKEISEDSDNLLRVINELKDEKIVADEKMKCLLESNVHEEHVADQEKSEEDFSQEEVNESQDKCEDDEAIGPIISETSDSRSRNNL